MRSNFLRQKSAQVGVTSTAEDDKENKSQEFNKDLSKTMPDNKEDKKELSEEEKAALAKKQEEEAVERII